MHTQVHFRDEESGLGRNKHYLSTLCPALGLDLPVQSHFVFIVIDQTIVFNPDEELSKIVVED